MFNLGQKVKELAYERKVSGAELAKALDLTKEGVYAIFKRENIDTGLLLRIAYFFSVPITYFFDTPPKLVFEDEEIIELKKKIIELEKELLKDKRKIIELMEKTKTKKSG